MTTTRAVQLVATCRQLPYLHKAAIVIVMYVNMYIVKVRTPKRV